MRHIQTLGQNGASVRQMPDGSLPAAAAPTVKEIPYDYVATFKLEGRPGNRVQSVINISTEGAFVAVAIGYSFIPARLPDFSERPDQATRDQILSELGDTQATTFVSAPLATLVQIALNANLNARTLSQLYALTQIDGDPLMILQCLLARLCGIDFKYSIIDSATGRELQNLPIHNIAGLGEAAGDRPFRPLSKPVLFMPRSTIRIEIEEISKADFIYKGAELFIVFHGYKILGYGTGMP